MLTHTTLIKTTDASEDMLLSYTLDGTQALSTGFLTWYVTGQKPDKSTRGFKFERLLKIVDGKVIFVEEPAPAITTDPDMGCSCSIGTSYDTIVGMVKSESPTIWSSTLTIMDLP
jgi:hypothetical protein